MLDRPLSALAAIRAPFAAFTNGHINHARSIVARCRHTTQASVVSGSALSSDTGSGAQKTLREPFFRLRDNPAALGHATRASGPQCTVSLKKYAQRTTRPAYFIWPLAAMHVGRRASRLSACAGHCDRVLPLPVGYASTRGRHVWPMHRAPPRRPNVRQDAAALRCCRSTCSPLLRALHRVDQHATRSASHIQSACLRKNAGMSYVSTPFSCSACT